MTCRFKAARTDEIQQGRGAAVVRKANAKCMKTVDSLLDLMSTTHSSPYEIVSYLFVVATENLVRGDGVL
jgi:hypothetical protein